MSITPYVSSSVLKATLNMTGQTFADTDFTIACDAASRVVDNYCGRRFYLDADAAQIRYFTATDPYRLFIDDLAVLTSVAVDLGGGTTYGTTRTSGTDFDLEPFNAESVTGDSWPYTMLRVRDIAGSWWPLWHRSVKVTGQWGWPTVPAPVTQATTIVATGLLKRAREAPFGVAGIGVDGTAIRIPKLDSQVCALLDPYSKVALMV